jgi:hypothetical protein
MTILLAKDLIVVAIIVLVIAIAAVNAREARRTFWR